MKILIHLIFIVVGAGIGLAVGFALRNKPVGPAAITALRDGAGVATSAVRQTESSFAARPKRDARGDDSPLATKLERDLSMTSGVTRWLYWLEALEKATLADYPRLAQLAAGNTTLVRAVGARWVETDPAHLFNTLLFPQGTGFPANELQRVLFEEWPKRDVEAVIAALSRKEGVPVPDSWRRNFATSLMQKNVETGLRLMSEWNVENHGPQMTGVRKWAAANPRHAAEFALAHPAGYASELVMETIGKEWARTDPAGALDFAVTHRGQLASMLAGSVLKNWTDRNLTEAADWLTKTDSASRNRLSPAFVEGWAKYDAPSALKWCEANLTGITFVNAAAGLVKGAAESDLPGAADLVASMTPSRGRGEAATILMQKWLPNYSSEKPVSPEATAWLARLDAESIRRVLEQVKSRWAEHDARSLLDFVASRRPEELPPQIYSTLARSMARKNPMEAVTWANGLPPDRRLQAGNEAFGEWWSSQPAAARQWLNELPPGDERREPFFQSAISTMAHDPRAPEQLAAMTPTEQAAARTHLEKMPIPEERRRTLLEALPPR